MEFHHFALTVKDLKKSMDFYISKLGFEISGDDTSDKNYIYLKLGRGNVLLELIHSSENSTNQECGATRPYLALSSSKIEKDLQNLESKGCKSLHGLQIIPGDVKIFTVVDPDGYYIDVGQKIR